MKFNKTFKNLSKHSGVKGKRKSAILIQAYGNIVLEWGAGEADKKWKYGNQEKIKA